MIRFSFLFCRDDPTNENPMRKNHSTNINSCEGFLCQSISTIIICLIIGLILFLIIVLFLSRNKLRKSFSKCRSFIERTPSIKINNINNDHDEKDLFLNPNNKQEIHSNEISFGQFLKSGRFSKIYQGIYQRENIAIKMLTSIDDNDEPRISFEHEKSIYSLPFMNHFNILK